MEPNDHRSRSVSDVSSFSTVLSFYTIRVRALCVQEPQFRCISSAINLHFFVDISGNFYENATVAALRQRCRHRAPANNIISPNMAFFDGVTLLKDDPSGGFCAI